jgi:hypothetical protein
VGLAFIGLNSVRWASKKPVFLAAATLIAGASLYRFPDSAWLVGAVIIVAAIYSSDHLLSTADDRRGELLFAAVAATTTALVAIFAASLFATQQRALQYEIDEGFRDAAPHVVAEVLDEPQIDWQKRRITVKVRFTNASAYKVAGLVAHYRHWDGSSWLDLLTWRPDEGARAWLDSLPWRPAAHGAPRQPVTPMDISRTRSLRGTIESQTAADLHVVLQKGLYFALQTEWDNPGHGRTCRTFFVRIATIAIGVSAPAPRKLYAGFVAELPLSLRVPDLLPPCRGSRGVDGG